MLRLLAAAALLVCTDNASAGVVDQLASTYATDHPDAKSTSRLSVPEDYKKWFFSGFMLPGGIYTKSDLARDAYTAGQGYWRDHPDQRDQVFAEYGYAAVTMEGEWERGFEVSSFTPDAFRGQKWWMTPLGNVKWSQLGPDANPGAFGAMHVKVAGYLSAEGSYGHLDAYSRELIVTSFTVPYQPPATYPAAAPPQR